MIDYKKRDSEIMKMVEEGVPYQDIIRMFDISRERIRQIVNEFKLEEEHKKRAEKIRRTFRSTNDIEKKWPRQMIMDGLLFPRKVTWRLTRYFDKEDIQELSLKDLMDFLFSDELRAPMNRRQAIPAYREKEIGIITHSILVHHLSQQDLGESFNVEWQRRLDRMMRYFIVGMGYVPKYLRRYF